MFFMSFGVTLREIILHGFLCVYRLVGLRKICVGMGDFWGRFYDLRLMILDLRLVIGDFGFTIND